jgi:uncharacterized integral membrane protein
MTNLKLLTLLLASIATIIFYVQNQQLIALVFYGITIPIQFPVAVWVLLSVIAGILTSIALQILNNLGRSNSNRKDPARQPEPPPKPNKKPSKTPSAFPRTQTEELEWDSPPPPKKNWDGTIAESEPQIKREIKDIFPPQPEKNYEVERQPSREQKSGSVYSYTYREASKKDEEVTKKATKTPNSVDKVYDANYRVIDAPSDTQPQEPRSSNNDDDEEWI